MGSDTGSCSLVKVHFCPGELFLVWLRGKKKMLIHFDEWVNEGEIDVPASIEWRVVSESGRQLSCKPRTPSRVTTRPRIHHTDLQCPGGGQEESEFKSASISLRLYPGPFHLSEALVTVGTDYV